MELCHLSWTQKKPPIQLHLFNVQQLKIEERPETQEDVKFHFQPPPMLVQSFPDNFVLLLQSPCFLKQKIAFSKLLFNGGGSTQSQKQPHKQM